MFGAFAPSAASGTLHTSFFIPDNFINGKRNKYSYYSNNEKIYCAHNSTLSFYRLNFAKNLPVSTAFSHEVNNSSYDNRYSDKPPDKSFA